MPVGIGAGISTPACNNGALMILRNVIVTGYHTGILVNEKVCGPILSLSCIFFDPAPAGAQADQG